MTRRPLICGALALVCLSGATRGAPEPKGDGPPPSADRADRPDRERRGGPGPLGEGRTEKGTYFGVASSPAPASLQQQLSLPRGVGLVVEGVAPESPAAEAGLKKLDVLHKLNDQVLVNPQQLAVLVRSQKAGDSVSFTVLRDGKPQTVSAKLVERDVPPLEDLKLGMEQRGDPFRMFDDRFERFLPRPGSDADGPRGGADMMRQRLKELEQRLGQDDPAVKAMRRELEMRERMGNDPRGGGDADRRPPSRLPPPINLLGENATLMWNDGKVKMTYTAKDGAKTLVATDAEGKELFNGPIDTPEQIEKLPPEVKERLGRIHLPGGPGRPGGFGGPMHDGKPGRPGPEGHDRDRDEGDKKSTKGAD